MAHPSGRTNVVDRTKPQQQAVLFHGVNPLVQGGELNESQTIARNRQRRVSNLIAKDGDRIDGGEAIVDNTAQTVQLTGGKIYVDGDVIPVEGLTLTDVPMDGFIEIGVRLVTSWVTSEEDPELLGQVPGSVAEGEPGADREVANLSWALANDGGDGRFVPVYLLQNGTILDQTPPPALSGITNAISVYDYGAHGHYIVSGHRVTALGKSGTDQLFSIEQGEANVHGIKLVRQSSLRFAETESWDIALVPGETHIYPAGASFTFDVYNFPIASINSIFLTKEKTISVTRGATQFGADALEDTSVLQVIAVVQGGTTFIEGADWTLVGNNVDWAPAGAEPAGGDSYNVTYRYRSAISPDAFSDKSITVSGGATGGEVLVSYTWKLPRIDLLCLSEAGSPVYVAGVSSTSNTLAPRPPANLLGLAAVHNDWMGTPRIENSGIYNRDFVEIDRMARQLEDMTRTVMILRSEARIDQREPVAKRNMFVDPFTDDTYRDAGEVQTAAVGGGVLQLPVSISFYYAPLTQPVMLDYVEDVIIRQERATACVKVNPYQNFNPMPAGLSLSPSVDFWDDSREDWASPQTIEFYRGVRGDLGPLEQVSQASRSLGSRTEQATFLRQITVSAAIEGFAPNEPLSALLFDGIDVKSGDPVADENGSLGVSFTIPANVPAGTKAVFVQGAGGSQATALFVGQGSISVSVMQRVTTVERWSAPLIPLIINVTEITNITEVTNIWVTNPASPPAVVPQFTTRFEKDKDVDPQAQSFSPPTTRQILGVDIKLCALGAASNALLLHQVTMDNGDPTNDVLAEAFVSMAGVSEGWISPRYKLPALAERNRHYAFVVKTDDADHAISVANLGDFDPDQGSIISTHPYPVGVRHSSANARSWTHHQGSAITCRVIAARFTQTTKTVDLGSHDLVDCTDLQVRAAVDNPGDGCSVVFEVERANGTIYRLLPEDVVSLKERITETVQLRAVLKGTATLSPVLYAPVILISGNVADSATYVSRAFKLGSAIRLTAYFKAFLPAGASVSLQYDHADDNWVDLPLASTEALAFANWSEPKHELAGITAEQGRLKITVNGGPAARPLLGDFGAAVF